MSRGAPKTIATASSTSLNSSQSADNVHSRRALVSIIIIVNVVIIVVVVIIIIVVSSSIVVFIVIVSVPKFGLVVKVSDFGSFESLPVSPGTFRLMDIVCDVIYLSDVAIQSRTAYLEDGYLEYVFTGMTFLIGVFVFAAVVGNVGDVISNMNAARHNFQARTKAIDEQSVLQLLPNRLRTEVAIHVHLYTLKKVRIFEQCEEGLLRELVLKLRPSIYSPGEYICRIGEIDAGVSVGTDPVPRPRTGQTKQVAIMTPGNYFGEISLLKLDDGQNKRTADVRSIGFSELLCLSRRDLMSALMEYPEAKKILEEHARQRMQQTKVTPSATSSAEPPPPPSVSRRSAKAIFAELDVRLKEKDQQLQQARCLELLLKEKDEQLQQARCLDVLLKEKEEQLQQARCIEARLKEKEEEGRQQARVLAARLQEKEEQLQQACSQLLLLRQRPSATSTRKSSTSTNSAHSMGTTNSSAISVKDGDVSRDLLPELFRRQSHQRLQQLAGRYMSHSGSDSDSENSSPASPNSRFGFHQSQSPPKSFRRSLNSPASIPVAHEEDFTAERQNCDPLRKAPSHSDNESGRHCDQNHLHADANEPAHEIKGDRNLSTSSDMQVQNRGQKKHPGQLPTHMQLQSSDADTDIEHEQDQSVNDSLINKAVSSTVAEALQLHTEEFPDVEHENAQTREGAQNGTGEGTTGFALSDFGLEDEDGNLSDMSGCLDPEHSDLDSDIDDL
nr:hypothetical protein BaRGS_035162 [Batillaria attramentaria]